MKTTLTTRNEIYLGLVLLSSLGLCGAVFAEDPLPKPFPPSHYDQLAAHSPFSPPTPTAPTPPPAPVTTPKAFEKYTLISLMQQGKEYYATLNNKENSEHVRVRTNDPGNAPDGLELASVEWANNPTETKGTLRKGTEFGVVTFDGSSAPAPAGVPGMNGAQRPGVLARPVTPPAFHPAPGVATNPAVPAPGMPSSNNVRRPAIIRSPGAAPQPGVVPGQPANGAQNPVPARRPLIPGDTKPANAANDDDDD